MNWAGDMQDYTDMWSWGEGTNEDPVGDNKIENKDTDSDEEIMMCGSEEVD